MGEYFGWSDSTHWGGKLMGKLGAGRGAVAVLYVHECVCIYLFCFTFSVIIFAGDRLALVLSSPNTYQPSELLHSKVPLNNRCRYWIFPSSLPICSLADHSLSFSPIPPLTNGTSYFQIGKSSGTVSFLFLLNFSVIWQVWLVHSQISICPFLPSKYYLLLHF